VKDSPFSPFRPLWCFLRCSLSLPCHMFAPSTPSRVAPRSRRSPARPAVVELYRRRLPFICEFVWLLFTWSANLPAPFFPFSYSQQRLHGLAGEADPPPSGAGRRGRPHLAPDLLGVCACFLSSCRACARTKWCPVGQSSMPR
jgi:hypothetical protein